MSARVKPSWQNCPKPDLCRKRRQRNNVHRHVLPRLLIFSFTWRCRNTYKLMIRLDCQSFATGFCTRFKMSFLNTYKHYHHHISWQPSELLDGETYLHCAGRESKPWLSVQCTLARLSATIKHCPLGKYIGLLYDERIRNEYVLYILRRLITVTFLFFLNSFVFIIWTSLTSKVPR